MQARRSGEEQSRRSASTEHGFAGKCPGRLTSSRGKGALRG